LNPEPDVVGRWLQRHREEILGAWRSLVLARLSAAPAAPSPSPPDPFGNPVGSRVHATTAAVLDALAGRLPPEALAAAMEPLMRVQAIQGRPASEAVALVPLLRRASREVPEGIGPAEAATLEERLDALLLIAFDLYMRCREDIFEIRVRETRRRVSALLDRLSAEDAHDEAGP
jgi:hypothetical protein